MVCDDIRRLPASPALPCLALPRHAAPCHALPACLALPCRATPSHALPRLALPCPALPCRAPPACLPCLAPPALPRLAEPCRPASPCRALPCPACPPALPAPRHAPPRRALPALPCLATPCRPPRPPCPACLAVPSHALPSRLPCPALPSLAFAWPRLCLACLAGESESQIVLRIVSRLHVRECLIHLGLRWPPNVSAKASAFVVSGSPWTAPPTRPRGRQRPSARSRPPRRWSSIREADASSPSGPRRQTSPRTVLTAIAA